MYVWEGELRLASAGIGDSVREKKVLWVDTETGGVVPGKHALLQVAVLVEIDGQVVAEHDWTMRPPLGREVTDEALAVNGITRAGLVDRPSADDVKPEIDRFLGRYVNKYDREDKFTIAGYNVAAFDVPFLRDYWTLCGDKYFGSWFTNYPVDVMAACCMLRHYELLGTHELPNLKLATVCGAFGVALGAAHDALADILATRELWEVLVQQLRKSAPAATPVAPARDGRG